MSLIVVITASVFRARPQAACGSPQSMTR